MDTTYSDFLKCVMICLGNVCSCFINLDFNSGVSGYIASPVRRRNKYTRDDRCIADVLPVFLSNHVTQVQTKSGNVRNGYNSKLRY